MPRKDPEAYRQYMKEYMLRRYERRRAEAIEHLGAKCVRCGSSDSLEFDHIEAEDKTYNLAKILAGGSEAKVAEEVAKCQLLCSDCHTVKTVDQQDYLTRRYGSFTCDCGREFSDRMAYGGHKRWCK